MGGLRGYAGTFPASMPVLLRAQIVYGIAEKRVLSGFVEGRRFFHPQAKTCSGGRAPD
jgi:hypothetical protein